MADKKENEKINFLIGGKHGSNMDTMIIAQVDVPLKKIKLVSIPRDTFFNDRKLNSYSIDQIKSHLGIITGLHVDHHLIIDMYAFIEVVDTLGGIDFYLKEKVVDGTYKTFDNGQWSTLNYEKGWHHLSGVQALRLARSRHTSSDFARAERQQNILAAIKKKITSLKVNDGAQVIKLANAILSKLETDLALKDIMTYQFRYKSFDFEARGVLSTANVLASEMYVSPTAKAATNNCLSSVAEDGKPAVNCPSLPRGQYILKPKNDWNTVRWYVNELLKD